ncbi:hypothetical protein GGH93_003055 [Coemansia aciculifera]|nr:hypothetical protein GGH93_003055 [Coemansia aciculifera]
MDLVIHSDDEDDTDDKYYERYPRPSHQVSGKPSNAYLGYPTLHLFKELEIAIDEAGIYSGAALRMLSCPPYDGCPFPQIRRLILNLTTNDVRGDRKTSSPGDQINISAFVQRVMEMAPMVSDIQVTSICDYMPPEINSPNFIDLISQLFRLVTRVEFIIVDISDVPVTLHLNDIRDLVHIKYTTLENSDQFMLLARQNAPTLESLLLHSLQDFDFAGIFQNADGGYITYPRLHTLKLADMTGIHDPAQLVSRGVVPFLRLRHIQLRSYYPFGDDMLFRGNAASLESLDMQLSIADADMLRECNVFTPTSHPKPKYVKVSVWSSTYYTTAEDLKLGLSIGIQAPVREIIQSVSGFKLGPAFISVGNYAYIRVLILPSLNLHLLNTLIVIKSLPILSDLHASFPIIGIIPPGGALDDLPMYIVPTLAPTGERFRCWNFGKCDLGTNEEAAKCLLILALVCPNFTYSISPCDARKQFKTELEDAIALDMFSYYAPRLQLLLSHGWSDC